jgi:hypothetical protein
MSYCSLEEAWNLSDNEDGELEYQDFQKIDDNYFDEKSKNKKERDFQNHEIEVTRRNGGSQLTKMENNFNIYDQREQKSLRNVRTELEDNMLADNSLNSNYSFLGDDFGREYIQELEPNIVESEENMLDNNSLNSRHHFLDERNQRNVRLNNSFNNIDTFENTENKQPKREPSSREIDNIDLKVHEKLLINIMERLDAIDKKLSTKKEERNNVHDIVLFIVIGIFILFALDSIFRIGRLTI